MTTHAVPPDVAAAWQLVGELGRVTPTQAWAFDRLEAQVVVAAVLARAGLADSARHLLELSRGNAAVDPAGTLHYYEAFVRTMLGDRDDALRLLKEYVANNPERRTDLAHDYQWWFRDLRGDPRYRQLAGINGP